MSMIRYDIPYYPISGEGHKGQEVAKIVNNIASEIIGGRQFLHQRLRCRCNDGITALPCRPVIKFCHQGEKFSGEWLQYDRMGQ